MSYEAFGEWIGRRKHETSKKVQFFFGFLSKKGGIYNKIYNNLQSTGRWPKSLGPVFILRVIGAVFKDLKTGQFLDRDIISKPTVPSTWKKELVGTVYILDVAPWWYLSDLTEALAPSVQCRYIANRVKWSVGEMRTATWQLTGESVSQLIGKVYLSDFGMPPMFVISEADYEARKKRITDRLRNTNDAETRKQGLITAGEMAKAMELDDQVDKVISSLKRKRDLKEDEASSSNGVAR